MQPRTTTNETNLFYQRLSQCNYDFNEPSLTKSLAYNALLAIHQKKLKKFSKKIAFIKHSQFDLLKQTLLTSKSRRAIKIKSFIKNLEQFSGGKRNKNIHKLDTFIGFFALLDLNHFFTSLESCFETVPKETISFILNCNQYALTASYSRTRTPRWTFIDAERRAPEHLTRDQLIQRIFSYYPASEVAALTIDMYCQASAVEFVKKSVHDWQNQWHMFTAKLSQEVIASSKIRAQIHQAIRFGQYEIVYALLIAGIDINIPDENGAPLLATAAQFHQWRMAKLLIKYKADINMQDDEGMTPLLVAAKNDNSLMIATLLAAKANINHQNKKGVTSLQFAVKNGSVRTTEKLLDAKADSNIPGTDGWMPIFSAAMKGFIHITKLLIKYQANIHSIFASVTPIRYAAENNHIEVLEILMAARADIEIKDESEQTLLHYPAEKGYHAIIEKLLAAKADPNACDKGGLSALHRAVRNEHKDIVISLLKAGANPNLIAKIVPVTPLSVAIVRKNHDIINILLEFKANPNQRLPSGASLLELSDNTKIMKQLTDAGISQIPPGQRFIINRMKMLGLKADDEGVCYGIVCMAMQAFLAGKFDDFQQRLEMIARIPEDEFLKYLDAPKDYALTGYNLDAKTTELMYEIPAFLQGIDAYFSTRRYLHLFPKLAVIDSQNFQQTLSILAPVALNPEDVVCLETIDGIYTKDELECFFTSLYTALASTDRRVLFKLLSINHAIGMFYDPQVSPHWGILDPNSLPLMHVSKEDTANYLMQKFQSEDRLALNSQIFVHKKDVTAVKACIDTWKNQPRWKTMHAVTTERVALTDGFGATWLDIAAANARKPTPLIKAILEAKADPNHCKNNGKSPLWGAALNGKIELVTLLKEYGASIETSDHNRATSLHAACMNGQIETVKFLLATGMNPNIEDKFGRSPIYETIYHNRTEILSILIEAKANIHKTKEDESPLFVAAHLGHSEMVQALIHAKADVDECIQKDVTALYVAAEKGHIDTVRVLLEAKADSGIEHGKTLPIFTALSRGHFEVYKLLLYSNLEKFIKYTDHDNDSLLTYAAFKGYTEIVTELLHLRADIQHCDIENKNALHIAIEKNHKAITKCLLEAKADCQKLDKTGLTPLHVAIRASAYNVIPLLMQPEYQCNVNATNNRGETPAKFAAGRGYFLILEALQTAKADLSIPDNEGVTPLMHAIQNDHLGCAEFLIDQSTNLDSINAEGKTAIYYAVKNKSYELLERLIEKKANVNLSKTGSIPLLTAAELGFIPGIAVLLKNNINVNQSYVLKEGQYNEINYATAAIAAAANNQVEALDYLIQLGADLGKTTENGHTPFHWAARNKADATIEYLLKQKVSVDLLNEKTGETALIIAAKEKNLATVRMLLLNRANPFIINHDKHSALYYAIQNKDWDMIKLFIHVLNLGQLSHEDQTLLSKHHKEIAWSYYQAASAAIKEGQRSPSASLLMRSSALFKPVNITKDQSLGSLHIAKPKAC